MQFSSSTQDYLDVDERHHSHPIDGERKTKKRKKNVEKQHFCFEKWLASEQQLASITKYHLLERSNSRPRSPETRIWIVKPPNGVGMAQLVGTIVESPSTSVRPKLQWLSFQMRICRPSGFGQFLACPTPKWRETTKRILGTITTLNFIHGWSVKSFELEGLPFSVLSNSISRLRNKWNYNEKEGTNGQKRRKIGNEKLRRHWIHWFVKNLR